MKVCIVCGHEKPLDQFPTNRGMKDGHLGWCFDCFKERSKYYHYPPPPKEVEPEAKRPKLGRPRTQVGRTPEECEALERRREYNKYYQRRNKEKFLERTRARSRRYYWANREKELARQKEYRKRNKEELAAKRKAYYEAHKEEFKELNRLNYERRKNACPMQKQLRCSVHLCL